jgi:hypothetical protein
MRLERRLSATQLASLALGCSLLLFGIVTFDAFSDFVHLSIRVALWIGGLELLFGIAAGVVMYRALAAFQRGIDDCRWNQDSLYKLKKQLNNTIATAFVWILIAVLLGYVAVDLPSHWFRHHHTPIGGLTFFWMSPAYAIGILRRALNPKLPRSQSLWRDEIKPIHSDQWGHRGPSTPAA